MTPGQIICTLLFYGLPALWVVYDGIRAISTRKARTRYGDVDGKEAVSLGWIRIIVGIFVLSAVMKNLTPLL